MSNATITGLSVFMAASSVCAAQTVGRDETIVGKTLANATATVQASPPTALQAPSSTEGRSVVEAAAEEGIESQDVMRRSRPTPVRQTLHPAGGEKNWFRDGLVALGIVLGMIGAAAAAMKRWGGKFRAAVGGGDRNLELVSRLALSPKQSVCLVRLGRQVVLLGVTPEQITPLTVVEDQEAVFELLAENRGSGGGLKEGFARFFSHASSSYGGEPSQDPAAEIPLAGGQGRFHQARMEVSGLLDKLRSRGGSPSEVTERYGDQNDGEIIAIA